MLVLTRHGVLQRTSHRQMVEVWREYGMNIPKFELRSVAVEDYQRLNNRIKWPSRWCECFEKSLVRCKIVSDLWMSISAVIATPIGLPGSIAVSR